MHAIQGTPASDCKSGAAWGSNKDNVKDVLSNRIAQNPQDGAEPHDQPLKSNSTFAIGGAYPLYKGRVTMDHLFHSGS